MENLEPNTLDETKENMDNIEEVVVDDAKSSNIKNEKFVNKPTGKENSAVCNDDVVTSESSQTIENKITTFIPVKKPNLWKRCVKRCFDLVSSSLAIILLSPFFIIFTPIVAIAMKGNPFFIQKRPGKDEKIFSLIKYRTMTNAKDKDGNLLPDEMRLTNFGKIIRKLSIDELPELFNIFLGQMSVVGPRPQLVKDLVFMDKFARQRHIIRPGLTGLAQINGRNNQTWEERFEYDIEYINKVSVFYDLNIIFKTIGKVFSKSDVSTDSMATAEDYGDYLLRLKKIVPQEYDKKISEVKALLTKKK